MSRTFSTNCGSVDSLKVSCLCGLSPNALQIRDTADWLISVASAWIHRRRLVNVVERVLQLVFGRRA